MKTLINIMLPLLVILFSSAINAQDTIKKKNGEVLKVVVKEINDSQIKYYHFDDPNQVLFTLDRMMVTDIKFSYGREYKEEEPILTKDYFEGDAGSAIKINISSILFDAAILSYEKTLSISTALETSIKIHGIGFGPSANSYENKSGFGAEFGYKVRYGSKKKNKWEYRPKHLMSGGYIMPNIGFDIVRRESSYMKETSNIIHIGANFGKVDVIQNKILIEYYAGFSVFGGQQRATYTYNGSDEANDNNIKSFGDMFGAQNIAVNIGMKMGIAFGQYGSKKVKRKRK